MVITVLFLVALALPGNIAWADGLPALHVKAGMGPVTAPIAHRLRFGATGHAVEHLFFEAVPFALAK